LEKENILKRKKEEGEMWITATQASWMDPSMSAYS
jgi:hypothetical protein